MPVSNKWQTQLHTVTLSSLRKSLDLSGTPVEAKPELVTSMQKRISGQGVGGEKKKRI